MLKNKLTLMRIDAFEIEKKNRLEKILNETS